MSFRRTTPLLLHLAAASSSQQRPASLLHEWLATTCFNRGIAKTQNFQELPLLLSKCGIARVGFLRHGKTESTPLDNGGKDFDRQLSELGMEQAKQAGEIFGKKLKPFFSKMLVSPAPRTIDSAKLFLDGAAQSNIQLHTPSILYDGTMQPEGSLLFRKIGYAPLQDYLNCANDHDRNVARTCLGAYAQDVIVCILELLRDERKVTHGQPQPVTNGSTLWMVGHAIYLPMAAWGVATLVNSCEQGKNVILSKNTLEAEGYLIDTSDKSVSYLSRTVGTGECAVT